MKQWKPINGYDISDEGDLLSLLAGRLLKTYLNQAGYLYVHLRGGSKKQRKMLVHLLVAQAFILNTEFSARVIHLDGNIHNNNVLNLQWSSWNKYIEHRAKHNYGIT